MQYKQLAILASKKRGKSFYFNVPQRAEYHRGDREFARQAIDLLEEGYYLVLVLDIQPQLTDRIIDYLAYPYTNSIGAPFKYLPNLWGYPSRPAKTGNPSYRYLEASQFREAIALLRESSRKTAILIGDSPVNKQFLNALREYDPAARLVEFYDFRDRVIGYRYLTSR